MDELINTDNLAAILQEYAVAVKELYKDRLTLHDRIASRKLIDSIETRVDYDGQEYAVVMRLWDYWRYIEMDTAPHWPPRDAILKWIQIKPVLPRPMKNGKLPTPEQLAFLISRKIAVFGTTGIPDLTDSVEDMDRQFSERIAAALAQDVGDYIRKVFRNS